ncbi:methylamine utilization protein [Pseudomonas sp. J452]|uniref:methylamine utilization protein n=1 Tax=Pseudomonas sp. J452 TaxID=2898441 RepID=UPI0021ADB087|nr:methylamine utilization protein [Pseudomonas sp. J452]UUY08454.1 methylamine utilization protein [Pseudomonas sp. J452]
MGKLGVGLLAGLLWSGWLAAASLDIQVTDKHGGPLADAVLWIEPGAGQAPAAGLKVNQEKRQFVPYILAVQAGTTVSFPNADPINHHVYSFSPAKRFELRLQKQQDLPQDVLFDKPGLVTLGCNIHDWMLGFILVLDSPWFAQTDAQGQARIDYQPAAGQRVHVWHPRIADPAEQQVRTLAADGPLLWRLSGELKPDPRPKEPSKRPQGKGGYAP